MPGRPEPVLIDLAHPTFPPEIAELRASDPAMRSLPHYRYLREVLQVLQWARGGRRWVLKSPQHIEQFPAIPDTFPDATFVVTHRDPVAVTRSMCTMITYACWMALDPDVRFDEFMADDVAMIERFDAHVADHPRDRFGV